MTFIKLKLSFFFLFVSVFCFAQDFQVTSPDKKSGLPSKMVKSSNIQ